MGGEEREKETETNKNCTNCLELFAVNCNRRTDHCTLMSFITAKPQGEKNEICMEQLLSK